MLNFNSLTRPLFMDFPYSKPSNPNVILAMMHEKTIRNLWKFCFTNGTVKLKVDEG